MSKKEFKTGLEGLFGGFTDLLEKLGDLAEKGETLHKSGTLHGSSDDVKGVFGFTVKVGGLGDKGPKVEPFGNIRKDESTGESVVQEMREPMVDLFEEKDHLLVVAEMPGISAIDVKIDVKGDLLTIMAEKNKKKYRKEVLLPKSYSREKMEITCNNGMLEIKCTE
jgi:HSP20 family protein